MSRSKTRTMIRSDSSRGNLFGNIDKKISRTFSLSSSEADDEDNDRFEGAVVVEGFADEGTSNAERRIVKTDFGNNHATATTIASLLLPPDLRVPFEKAHVRRRASGFFMESMIRRDETKTRFIMYQQSTKEARPIFCAQKYPPSDGGHILIKSVHNNINSNRIEDAGSYNNATITILGSLVKKKKQNPNEKNKNKKKIAATTTITYELILHEPAVAAAATKKASLQTSSNNINKSPLVVATIDYEQVSRARYFLEGGFPRCAKVEILGKECGWVETKEPNQRSNGQKVLDFGGRGRETSSKNTQLVSNNDGGCCLQMVKWKDHEFNLDFSQPFDAFHAFAFALAQFDF